MGQGLGIQRQTFKNKWFLTRYNENDRDMVPLLMGERPIQLFLQIKIILSLFILYCN